MHTKLRSGLALSALLLLGVGGATFGCDVGPDSESDADEIDDGDDVADDDAGEPLGEGDEAIVGGTDALPAMHHGVARMFFRTVANGTWNLSPCSVVMLSNRWAMTSASCVGTALERYPSWLSLQVPPWPEQPQAVEVVRNVASGHVLIRLATPLPMDAPSLARQINGQPTSDLAFTGLSCWGYGGNVNVAQYRSASASNITPFEFRPLAGGVNVIQAGDQGGGCFATNNDLVGTHVFEPEGSSTDRATVAARGFEGQARTTQTVTAAETGLCLDVWNLGLQDGALMQTYYCMGYPNQNFRLVDVDAGYVQVRAEHSGKCVAVEAGAGTNSQVKQLTCEPTGATAQLQHFRVEDTTPPGGGPKNGVRFVHRSTGLCLDRGWTAGANSITRLQLCNGSDTQRWTLTTTADKDQEGGQHSLRNVGNNKCVDVPGGGVGSIALDQWDCVGAPQEEVTVDTVAGGYGGHQKLRFSHSNQCLEAASDGVGIRQESCAAQARQEWKLIRRATGYEVHVNDGDANLANDKCLTAAAMATNGAGLSQTTCDGNTRQIWTWQ